MSSNLRFAAVHVALCAMLLRALLPTGWMPNPSATVSFPITICTMDGAVHVLVDANGQPLKKVPSQDHAAHHDICPFGAAPHFSAPVGLAAIPAPSGVFVIAQTHSASQGFIARMLYAPQSPRAPPHLV